MRSLIFSIVYMLYAVHAAPQFVTFKDGKIGVNFGGYHAAAGLGGLLTGNAAHGGLSASAGTPWGQNAAAGLGGAVDGRSSGFGYAGAQATPNVGASAVLGGTAGEEGFIGSEAHANGKIHTKTLSSAPQSMNRNYESHSISPVTSGPAPASPPVVETRSDFVQKIKPPKKYSLIKNEETHSTIAPAEIADRTLIANGSGDTAGVDYFAAGNADPTTMIQIHRQRMRERRRQQQQHQETENDLQQRRTNEHRMRTRQRLHQRQRVVVKTKEIQLSPTSVNIATEATHPMQNSANTDVNAVHSKRLIKNYYSTVNTQADTPVSTGPNNDISVHYSSNPGVLTNILNIPIGILRTIQDSLSGVQVEKTVSVSG